MLSKFNNKKHRRLTALLLCVALMLGSVTSVSADISAADSETEAQSGVQTYAEESTAEAVSYEAPEAQTEVQEEAPVAEETEAPAADTQQTEAHTEAATEAHTETAAETQAAETTETEVETETETEVVAQQLEYEDDQVKVHVTASEEGIIPDHASLKVVPLVKQEVTNEMTDEQKQEVEAINKKYDEAEQKLIEKADSEAFDIAGFLAYDIGFVDAGGNEVEPNGDVKVTMEYKKAQAPEGIEVSEDTELTVMHLEEDKNGEVKQVVDLADDNVTNGAVEKLQTNEENKLEKVEFVSDSFSTFTVTWTNNRTTYKLRIYYVDENGVEIQGTQIADVSKDFSNNKSVTFGDYAGSIEGYSYKEAHLNSVTGNVVTAAEGTSERDWYGYYSYSVSIKNGTSVVETLQSRDTSANIYLVYHQNAQETETPDTPDKPSDTGSKLSHEKYIKKNADNTYDITLNASGSVGTEYNKAKLDILFIVDTSESMKNEDRISETKKAINALTAVFDSNNMKNKVDVRYKMVTFATGASLATTNWVDSTVLGNAVKNLHYVSNGGTNYDQGLSAGANALSTGARTDARKIVIFLTDGEPTFYGIPRYHSTWGQTADGRGGSTSRATLDAAITSAGKIKCDDFYAVGISLKDDIVIYTYDNTYYNNREQNTKTGEGILGEIKDATGASGGKVINLKKPSDLSDEFEAIAGETIKFACTNVMITDKLSKYVATTENSRLQVMVAKRVDGKYTQRFKAEYELEKGGNIVLKDKDGKDKVIATASYDKDAKTATLDFVDDYELEEDYYYYITITNVEPSQEAYDEYLKNGYTQKGYTGDTPTDTSDNGYYATDGIKLEGGPISSGQTGFKSNEEAKVEYTWKKTPKTEDYKDPVIKLEDHVQHITVEKKWSGVTDVDNNVVLAQLVKVSQDEAGNTTIETPVDGKIIELTKDKSFEGSFTVQNASEYVVRELKPDANGKIIYKNNRYSIVADEDTITFDNINYKVSYNVDITNRKITITNTKASEKIRIIKTGTDTQLLLQGAEFTLKDSEGNTITVGTNIQGDKYVSDDKGLVLEGEIGVGTYTLTEIKAPTGYVILPSGITITVDINKVTVLGAEDKVTCVKDSDGVYVITVKNEVVYNLPNSGGSGIYWFSICGMLLMMAAAWIIYKNKCREVLVK